MNKVIPLKERNSKRRPSAMLETPAVVASDTILLDDGMLRRAAEKIVALNCKSTAHAYDLGEAFNEAKALVPEKRFGQWLNQVSDYSVRSAWNYISIHEKLQNYREQMLAHTVTPTVMFELAKGEPAQIDAVIARMETGERIRVRDVKAAFGIRSKKTDASSLLDTAGIAGLRKAAQLKIDQDVAAFNSLMSSVLAAVEAALEPLTRKRMVGKGDLHRAVVYDCRHAHDLLNSVAAPLQPDVTDHMNWRAAKLPEDTMWGKVQAALYVMGGSADAWPKRDAFVDWLQNEVVPVLRFVVHGEPMIRSAIDTERRDEDNENEQLDRVA